MPSPTGDGIEWHSFPVPSGRATGPGQGRDADCQQPVPFVHVIKRKCTSRTETVVVRHMSFRLTPPAYMRGKRVKPHLRVLANISAVCMLLAGVLAFAALVRFITVPAGAFVRNSDWLCVLFGVGLPYVAARLVCAALRLLYERYGLMTQEEAQDFPFRGRWPDSWLETHVNGGGFPSGSG